MYSYLPPKPIDKYFEHVYFNIIRSVLILLFVAFLTDILKAQPPTLKTNGSFYKKINIDKIPPEQTLLVHLNFNKGLLEITWVVNSNGLVSSFFSIVEGNMESNSIVLDATFQNNKYERVGFIHCRNLANTNFLKRIPTGRLDSVITYHIYFLGNENKILNTIDIPIQFFNKSHYPEFSNN
ncbi:MAG: hypothetical protein A3H98_06475 [Bacteroidetes bacterium RIFCSPLOWO2_02_FULL_36_8]|nr:MAG: hypothetical protein A3H98_06475 [Bacteroidetes bacterium RIFCSPLOWO2_02_FULL_36_8]OFY71110.1 MAG: hypothetical protein A3G23_14980 [Bacteroidetes bacterium RIFCSPLOWO2_12_FULL_37_12]